MLEPHPVLSAESAAAPPRRRWPWWLLGVGLLLAGLWAALYWGLDPWLRRRLERQVTTASGGRYRLQVGELRTRLADRSVTLRGLRLRPTRPLTPADSLPVLAFDLPRLRLTGIDLLALWNRRPQHLDSLALTGLHLRLDSLPEATGPPRPLHERLPARVPGVRLAHLRLVAARLTYTGRRRPRATARRLDLAATDVQLDAAGAADTARLFYARAWQTHLVEASARVDHHRLRVRRLDLDTRPGLLTLDSLRLRPTRVGRRGPAYLTLRVGRGRLSGLRAAALLRRRFRADSLLVAGLSFDLKAPATPPPLPHEMIAKMFPQFELGDARLTDGFVRVRSVSRLPVIRDLRLHASGLRLTRAGWDDPARTYYAHAWELETGAGHTLVDVPFYRVAWAGVRAESRTGLFEVKGLHVAPTMGLTEMARRKGHEVSHITLDLPLLRATGFNFNALLHRQGLRVQTVALHQPRLFLRNDGRYRINPTPSVVTPERVGQLKFRVDIGQVLLTGGQMRFWYRGPLSPQPATGHLTAFGGTIRNATNDPARMGAAHPMVVRAEALLQGRCRVQATGTFNLLDPQGRHRLTGSFGAAPANLLNSVLEPASLVRVQTGTVQRIDVTMTGDRQGIRGELRGAYQDLHIRLLTPKLGQNLWTKVKSKAANKIIIPDDNPDKPGRALRVGRIQSRREPRFSVFALWKQGLISGVLNTIGLGEEKAQKMSETTTEPGK